MKKIILDRIIEAQKFDYFKKGDLINQISKAAKLCINTLNNRGKNCILWKWWVSL